MEAFLGQKRAATPADPSAALRAFFEVTSPAGTTAPSQQQGKCKGFGHQMTMRSDRMISHFAPNKTGAGSWSSCAKPPAGANELAQQVRDAGKSKTARKEETAAREASFIQKTLPDLFNMLPGRRPTTLGLVSVSAQASRLALAATTCFTILSAR